MLAKDIMGKVKAAKKSASVKDVAMKMLSMEYSSMPVVDDDGKVEGVISEFDILGAIRAGKTLEGTKVDELMSRDPLCIEENMTVEDLIDLMTKKHLIRVPVVRDGKLVGSISRHNILDSYTYHEFKESFWVLRG